MIVNLSREVDIISSLCHPCICQFIGYSPNNFKNVSKPVIITEFVPNGLLDNFIEMERNGIGHQDWDDTKKLINIFGIASGIKYLHDHDIIHRDLKPANILIDEMLYPKIADFGLSKKIPGEKHETNDKIDSSGFKGTYAYCAPEIIQRNEYSFKSDVYAFGIMVYEILTSKIHYEGFNQFSIILEISNGLSLEFDQSIPYCYRKLINKCCSYDPQERPHFSEIVRDLKNDPRFITKNVNEEDFLKLCFTN